MKNFKNIVIFLVFIATAGFLFQLFNADRVNIQNNDESKISQKDIFEKAQTVDQNDLEVDVKGVEVLDPEVEEVFISVRDLESSKEQGFSKSYKLLSEVFLDKAGKNVKLTLDKPIEEVYSIVIIGGTGEGESEIKGLFVNGKASSEASKSLEDRYFENDWKKFDQIDNKFKSISFHGRSIDDEASVKIYIQYQGEE